MEGFRFSSRIDCAGLIAAGGGAGKAGTPQPSPTRGSEYGSVEPHPFDDNLLNNFLNNFFLKIKIYAMKGDLFSVNEAAKESP
jgi:hypothetical protein